jgi:dipeptidyl aminopeptidase/acylaminoacyl peptidase
MTTFERFERSIPELMAELAPARVPDYFDDMLRETASHGQRPAWSYPERWLPMDTTLQPLTMRSFPWRPLAILALVALLIATGLAVYIGSQARLPSPFGAADNGVLLYRGADGSIRSVDPRTASETVIVVASDDLGDPIPSRDGQRVAFIPSTETTSRPIVVSAIDGSRRTTLDGEYRFIGALDWSPDGGHIAFVSEQRGFPTITVLPTDGSAARTLSLGRSAWLLRYLPDGRLAVVAGEGPGDACPGSDMTTAPCALFVVNADGSGLDRLIAADEFHGINTIDTSPDGTRILWVQWDNYTVPQAPGRLHVFDLATRVDRRVPDAGFPELYSINSAWFSPDGSAILFDFFGEIEDHWGVVPSAGGVPIAIGPAWQGGTAAQWAPDGRSILARFETSSTTSELWLLDPTGGGADRRLDVDVPTLPAWQRVRA